MVSEKDRKSALDGLRSFMEPTGAEPGCIRCSIACDADNPNLIKFTGKWQSQECLRQHIQSYQYKQLLSIIELSVREPEIGFYHITQTGEAVSYRKRKYTIKIKNEILVSSINC